MRPAVVTALSPEASPETLSGPGGDAPNTPFTQRVQIGPHQLVGDVSEAEGGADAGPSPHEYLAAALASCTAITLRMYARRKGWSVQGLEVLVDITHAAGVARFDRVLHMPLGLTEEQQGRLVTIANACPVHKTLGGTLEIETRLA